MHTLEVVNPKLKTLQRLIASPFVAEQLRLSLPTYLTPERMTQLFLSTISNDSKLLECDPASLIRCMMYSAQFGLEPGPFGLCYYVPFGKIATFIPGYKGALKTIRNSGLLRTVILEPVHTNDVFIEEYGLKPDLKHIPKRDGDRGPVTHYYCVIMLQDGGAQFKVMSVAEAERHRDEFSESYKHAEKSGKKNSAWHTDFDAMACKTVLLKTAKLCPLSQEAQNLLAVNEAAELGLPQPAVSLSTIPLDFPTEDQPAPIHPEAKKSSKRKLTTNTNAVTLPGYLPQWGNRAVNDPEVPLLVLREVLANAQKRLAAGYPESRKQQEQSDRTLVETLTKVVASREGSAADPPPSTPVEKPEATPTKKPGPETPQTTPEANQDYDRLQMASLHDLLYSSEAGKKLLYDAYDNFCINDFRQVSPEHVDELLRTLTAHAKSLHP